MTDVIDILEHRDIPDHVPRPEIPDWIHASLEYNALTQPERKLWGIWYEPLATLILAVTHEGHITQRQLIGPIHVDQALGLLTNSEIPASEKFFLIVSEHADLGKLN